MNRVLKLFRPNGKLSEFNNLSLKIVYGFVATLRLKLDKQVQEKQPPQARATKGTRSSHKASHTKVSSTLTKARGREQGKTSHHTSISLP